MTLTKGDRIHVSKELLDPIPKSKYRPSSPYIMESDNVDSTNINTPAPDEHLSDETIGYLSQDTELYWSLDNPGSTQTNPTKVKAEAIKPRRVIHAKPNKTHRFNIHVHGIRQRCHKYYFKCVVSTCNKSFNSIKEWNLHHQLHQ